MIVSTTFVRNALLSAMLGVGYADVTAMGPDVTLAPLAWARANVLIQTSARSGALTCPTERHEH